MDVLLKSVWTPSDAYAIVGVLFGAVSLGIDVWVIGRGRSGRRRQEAALEDLTRQITRLASDNTTLLISANHFRTLAIALQKQHRCAVITNKLIAEAVRAAVLNLEDRYRGAALVRRLELLAKVLKDLREDDPPVLSLASVDRLEAYIKSQPIAVLLVFVTLVVTAVLAIQQDSTVLLATSFGLLCAQLLMLVAAVRAERFWAKSRPGRPLPVVDFFLLATMSPSWWATMFWDAWAAVWELPRFLPWRSSSRFLVAHMFRFQTAARLARQLRGMQRARDLAAARGQPVPDDDRSFKALCRKLWIVTGDDQFRKIEHRGELAASDLTNGVLRYL